MKKTILLFLVLLSLACSNDRKKEISLTDHIPADSELILITSDLKQFFEELSNNEFLDKSNFPLKKKLLFQLSFTRHLNFSHPAQISFSGLSSDSLSFTITTKRDSALVRLDSVKNKSVETIREGGVNFKKIELEDITFFLHESGNETVLSNSRQKILDIGNNRNLLKDESFNKAYQASAPDKTSVFIKHDKTTGIQNFLQKFHFPVFRNFADWSVLDLEITNSVIKANGISLSNGPDSLLNVFSGTNPGNIESGKVCPAEFLSMYALSFSSFQKLQSNLKNFKKDSSAVGYPKVLENVREMANISLKEGNALVLNPFEIEAAKEKLAGAGETIETFRGYSIIKTEDVPEFQKALSGLMKIEEKRFYTILDHFIIFSDDPEILKKIIAAFQNSDTLSNKTYYTDLMSSLSSESSILFIARFPEFSDFTSEENSSVNLKFRKNSLAAFQIINEGDFAHLHGIFSNPDESTGMNNGTEQIASFKLDAPLATTPVFFKNHRTDQMDIAVQDEENTLYLISNKGTVFWKKKLDSHITSPLFEVDLFKNGNKQLAFSTGYNLEVLDRTGKTVRPFPVKFNDALTQPLAVFDYDNNRNYRFVLTQNQRVYMVGPKGNAISGFDFEKANSSIITAPKHIRLGTKDYILIAEESGKLNILSRQGNIRIPIKENISFSENEWFGYDNKFVSTAPKDELIEITQGGNISRKDLGLAANNRIIASDKHLVYLNENQLSIDGKMINLDFGLYTDPQLFEFEKRSFIAITDTQTQKVYVFRENSELLPGFPVYGNSAVDIANADLDSRLEMIVKGEENEILLYKL